jgi:DNA-binding transcriptional MerR regulator
MRISELSRASGVPIPTIKFYLREGLLPAGTATARTQADYADGHLRRLRLIRTLTEIGGLRLREVGAVLQAIDDRALGTHELLGRVHHALGPHPDGEPSPDEAHAGAEVDGFLDALGWRVSREAPGRLALARALATLRRLGRDADARVFEPYARAADELAAREVATVSPTGSRQEAVEAAVVGTVVFEAALVALRRLAQEHHSARRFEPGRGG